MKTCSQLALILAFSVLCAAANAQGIPPQVNLQPTYNAGSELNRTLRDLQRARTERELKRQLDEAVKKEEVPEAPRPQASVPEVTVALKKIEFTPSSVIPEEELRRIASEYENRQVSMAQLYEMIERVNLWYRTGGYVTAMAFLPPQKLNEGVLKVTLVEGKVGKVIIEGNSTTNNSYIRDRLNLPEGKLLSINSLNRDLVWFNGTNDLKLRIKLQAGTVKETTDYQIFAFEPPESSCMIFSDTAGSSNTGRTRAGINYTVNSMTGKRDAFSMTALSAKNSKSFLWNYSFPVSKKGSKISVYNSFNDLTVYQDDSNGFNIRGESSSAGVTWTSPTKIESNYREELVLDLQQQYSKNKVLGMTFVDDKEKRYSIGKTFLMLRSAQAIYLKPMLTYCEYDGLAGKKSVKKFTLDSLWQKVAKAGQQMTFRLNWQKTSDSYLPSADQIYLGGLYTVRGYDESVIGGDSGLNLKLDYNIPFKPLKDSQVFSFYDLGKIYGKSILSTRMIQSAGVGVKHGFINGSQVVLTVGFPFVKKIGDEKIASCKVDLAVNFIF